MNSKVFALALTLGLGFEARANYMFSFGPVNGAIPDNDPSGYQDSRSLAGLSGTISDVNVTLNIAGGFNGDLYAWVSHGSGSAMLLNRVGLSSSNTVGYANAGFGTNGQQISFSLDDQAVRDVHFYQAGSFTLNANAQLTGAWQPDGRVIDPSSSPSLFDAAPRSNMLGSFNGIDPNGEWTLFVADVSPLSASTLVGWGLNITTVPEPTAISLLFAGLAAGLVWRAWAAPNES